MNRSTRLARRGVRGAVIALGAGVCVAASALALLPLAAASLAGRMQPPHRPSRARLRRGMTT